MKRDATPFDRTADTRPLLHIVVDGPRVHAQDADAVRRVLALAELPFLKVRRRESGEPIGPADLLVASEALLHVPRVPVSVSPETALDLVRVLLVNLGLFYARHDYQVNEGFYYRYRLLSLFITYQPAWLTAVAGPSVVPAAVKAQLSSLGKRLEFLCRAADRAAYFALRRPDNDSESNTLYHFGYFIMLATGVFDDLAWVLNHQFHLGLTRQDVVLKSAPNGRPTRFHRLLGSAAAAVAARVTDPAFQSLLGAFYPIRDHLQHRQFVQGLLQIGGPWRGRVILFELPPEAAAGLRLASADRTGKEWGIFDPDTAYVDPYWFIRRAMRAVVTIHDQVLGALDWPRLLGPPGGAERDAVDAHLARFGQGVGGFLGWRVEPLYF